MSIDVRLRGTKEELETLTAGWIEKAEVLSISEFYPDRGKTKLGRMYIKIEPGLQMIESREQGKKTRQPRLKSA